MACNTEESEIGGKRYVVTQWPASKAMLMKMRLSKMFGASFALMTTSENISEAIATIFKDNDPEDVVKLIEDTVMSCRCDGEVMTDALYEQTFSGDDLMNAYKVFFFILKVNFSALFKGQKAEAILSKMKAEL